MLRTPNSSKCGSSDETDELVRQAISMMACRSQFRSVENMQQCRKLFAAAYVSTCVRADRDADPIKLALRAFELFARFYEIAEKSKVPEQHFRNQLMNALYCIPACGRSAKQALGSAGLQV